MPKVYFVGDNNVYSGDESGTKEYVVQNLYIHPDGKCEFRGRLYDPRYDGRNSEVGGSYTDTKHPDYCPWDVQWVHIDSQSGKLTQEDRKLFFEANKGLLQKVVDGLKPVEQRKSETDCFNENAKEARNELFEHGKWFAPDAPGAFVWYEKFPGKHVCGLEQEDMIAFADANNFVSHYSGAESSLNFIDELMKPDSFNHIVERIVLSPNKEHIFLQLTKPVCDPDTGKRLFDQYGEYSYYDFEYKVLPALGDECQRLECGFFKDTACGIPGASIEDLNCKAFKPIMDGEASISEATEAMLRCFNGTDYLDDFVKEFPKDAFPDFPEGSHDKFVSDGCLKANKESEFWSTDEAKDLSKKLYECLAKFAPKGVWFGYRRTNPSDLSITADRELGFWSSLDYGYKSLDFLWDQVSAGEHPAFGDGKPSKDGKVRVTVPKVSWADGSKMVPLGRFYAAAMCRVYDPQKGNEDKDFILQKDERKHDDEPVSRFLSFGRPMFTRFSFEDGKVVIGDTPVWESGNFVSVPAGKHTKVVTAMSSDPVDYIARFDLASKAGCDLSTTKEVMDGAKKKFSDWLGKYLFMERDYDTLEDKLVTLNEKIEKREKEIIAEMKEKRAQQKTQDTSHDKPVEAEPADAGFEL